MMRNFDNRRSPDCGNLLLSYSVSEDRKALELGYEFLGVACEQRDGEVHIFEMYPQGFQALPDGSYRLDVITSDANGQLGWTGIATPLADGRWQLATNQAASGEITVDNRKEAFQLMKEWAPKIA